MDITRIHRAQAGLKATDARSEAEKEQARKRDKQTHRELKELSRRTENSKCADCDSSFPGWAALPHGVFLCIDCAQVHRRVGRHVSQVKAINTGTYLWFEDEVEVMRAVGNGNSKALLLSGNDDSTERTAIATAATPNSKADAKLRYVQKKYQQRAFAAPQPQQRQKKKKEEEEEEEEQQQPQQRCDASSQSQKSKRQHTKAPSQLTRQKTPENFPDFLDAPPAMISAAFSVSTIAAQKPVVVKRKHQAQSQVQQQLYNAKAASVMSMYGAAPIHQRPTGASFFAEFGV
jgi:hypothetical protein